MPKMYLKKKMTTKHAYRIQIFSSTMCTTTGFTSGDMGMRNKYTNMKNTIVNTMVSNKDHGLLK